MKQRVKLWIVVGIIVTGAGVLHAETDGFAWGGAGDEVTFFDDASSKIEQRIAKGKAPALEPVYKELLYAPLWVKARGLSPFGSALLRMIRTDKTVTQSLKIYAEKSAARKQIDKLISQQGGTMDEKISLELALGKLYLHYARYRLYGGISWRPFARKLASLTKAYRIKVGWKTYRSEVSPSSILNEALNSGDLPGAFKDADPKRFNFAQLRNRLIDYIQISKEGGWPILPRFRTIKLGGRDTKVVPMIRQHLAITGDLQACSEPADSPKYDPCLVKAVKRFQLRHGLKAGGIVGTKTRAALNMTVTQAIQKIRLNLDRIKWFYRKQSDMRIELNIPTFRLNFFNGEKLVTTIRVITGKANHPTPSFHNVMKYIVVNPYWKIPEGIVKSEMLRHLIQDPYHYEAHGKELHESWDENSPRVDPGTVNWAQYTAKNKHIPYYFMQVPSRHNALGKIKFLFPNGYSVYIHDTPSKSLFFRDVRAFSHGCMRIQKPRELLESLALFNDNINVDGVMKQLEGTEKKTIVLKHYVPIDITYLTAYIDPYGYLNFRKDVYRYDRYQMKSFTPKCVSLSDGKPPRTYVSGKTKKAQKSSTPVVKKSAQGIPPKPNVKAQTKKPVPSPKLKAKAPVTAVAKKIKASPKTIPAEKTLPKPKIATKTPVAPKKAKEIKKTLAHKPAPKQPVPVKQEEYEPVPAKPKAPAASSASEMLAPPNPGNSRVDRDGYEIREVY